MPELDPMKRRLTWTVYATSLMTLAPDLGLSIRDHCPGRHQFFFQTFPHNFCEIRLKFFSCPSNQKRILFAVVESVDPPKPLSDLRIEKTPNFLRSDNYDQLRPISDFAEKTHGRRPISG